MNAADNASLPDIFRAAIGLLQQTNTPYLLIGGMAQAVIGEPRMTQDVDCIVFMEPSSVPVLLQGLQRQGFTTDDASIHRRLKETGTFSVTRPPWHVDFILASTEFERSALQRAQRVRLYGLDAQLPTPEDLILLKLVPGRDKDLLDAKIVALRHRATLDRGYLQQWAQRLSDEAEDARIVRMLQEMLREVDATR